MTGLEWVVAVVVGGVALFVVAELVARGVLRARREYFVLTPNTTVVLEVEKFVGTRKGGHHGDGCDHGNGRKCALEAAVLGRVSHPTLPSARVL